MMGCIVVQLQPTSNLCEALHQHDHRIVTTKRDAIEVTRFLGKEKKVEVSLLTADGHKALTRMAIEIGCQCFILNGRLQIRFGGSGQSDRGECKRAVQEKNLKCKSGLVNCNSSSSWSRV